TETLEYNGRSFHCYENGDLVAVASGIGSAHAEAAARALVSRYQPATLISAGLAGALIRSLKVGSIFLPSLVVSAASGEEYRCAPVGSMVIGGILVTSGEIAGETAKPDLVNRFHALVVDMEAAGVAKVAQEFHLSFVCVKAISDELDFAMPPIGRFIDAQGNMLTSKLVAWAAVRPIWWPTLAALGRNSKQATLALCNWLQQNVSGNPGLAAVKLERAELSQTKT
ncbi:MAG TPA: hypothetical protein VEW69_05000, partial [Alphaproteobacteria bacterium]|nr:hypothetical protein [Alphaproteobacteria bacterium]